MGSASVGLLSDPSMRRSGRCGCGGLFDSIERPLLPSTNLHFRPIGDIQGIKLVALKSSVAVARRDLYLDCEPVLWATVTSLAGIDTPRLPPHLRLPEQLWRRSMRGTPFP